MRQRVGFLFLERILSFVEHPLWLIETDILNAKILEDVEERFAEVAKRNRTVMRISLRNENMTVEGYIVTIMITARRGEATELARRFGGDFDLVCCAGGDGTLNETLSGLIPVSYTHLDVYKRQIQDPLRNIVLPCAV